jgi:hypothetical protein
LADAERSISPTKSLALANLAREYVRTQRYPLAPRLAPIKAALAKPAPADEIPPPPGRRRPKMALG